MFGEASKPHATAVRVRPHLMAHTSTDSLRRRAVRATATTCVCAGPGHTKTVVDRQVVVTISVVLLTMAMVAMLAPDPYVCA